MKRLDGVSALITGGASGVGRATAHRFAQEGATRVTLFDRDAERIEDVVAELMEIGTEPRPVVGRRQHFRRLPASRGRGHARRRKARCAGEQRRC